MAQAHATVDQLAQSAQPAQSAQSAPAPAAPAAPAVPAAPAAPAVAAPPTAAHLILRVTTPRDTFIVTYGQHGFVVARSAAERPKPTRDLPEPQRAALFHAAQYLLRDIDAADLGSVTGLSVAGHVSDHEARAILRGLLAALHPFDPRPCVAISVLCHGYGAATWRITMCAVRAVDSTWTWAGPFSAYGPACPLASLSFPVCRAKQFAAVALRFILTGQAAEVRIHAAIAPLVATAPNATNGLTGLDGLMLALTIKLVQDLLIPEEHHPPLTLTPEDASYFLTTASAACSHVAPAATAAPPQAPALVPFAPLVPFGPLVPLVPFGTRFELRPSSTNPLHFTLTLFAHNPHTNATTALRFTAAGTSSRRTISGPFTLGSAVASISGSELGFFTLAMMQCIQALATPPYPLLATLRLSLAGLLNLIHEAHSKLIAALDNSGFSQKKHPRSWVSPRSPFRKVFLRLCRQETQARLAHALESPAMPPPPPRCF